MISLPVLMGSRLRVAPTALRYCGSRLFLLFRKAKIDATIAASLDPAGSKGRRHRDGDTHAAIRADMVAEHGDAFSAAGPSAIVICEHRLRDAGAQCSSLGRVRGLSCAIQRLELVQILQNTVHRTECSPLFR